MGEISDALRRANTEREAKRSAAEPIPTRSGPLPSPNEGIYAESAERHARDVPTEGPPKDDPTPTDRTSPDADAANLVSLTHETRASLPPQAVLVDGGGKITDACLQMALRAQRALADREANGLLVVSAMRAEGKTTVSGNLALALASLSPGRRVALVDLDLRRPSIAKVLELRTRGRGIEDAIAGLCDLSQIRVKLADPKLDVYPCLRGQTKAHELLLQPDFQATVDRLESMYDVVVYDSPPVLLVPDATIILRCVKAFAPVARAGVTRARNFQKMLEALPSGHLLGAILDCGTVSTGAAYYDRYEPDDDDFGDAEQGLDAHERANGSVLGAIRNDRQGWRRGKKRDRMDR